MKRIHWIVFWVLINACIDPIKFEAPPASLQLVVDGFITDEPGPYTVTLSRARALDANMSVPLPEFGAKVTMLSDAGESEVMTESGDGVFKTKSIQGKVGRSYSIRITRADGRVYESVPEKMAAVGEVEAVNFKFERKTKLSEGVELFEDQFSIYADGRAVAGAENFVRWRMVGTYQIETFPNLIVKSVGMSVVPDPAPCSGYIVRNGGLFYVTPCTCCNCWLTDYNLPAVSDDQLLSGSVFRNVRVGSVPIGRRTFYDKYYVEVQQLALTRDAFNFWKLVKAQKDGATSLFQPPLAKLRGNVHNRVDPAEQVQGYFAAAAVKRKGVFITRQDVPYRLQPIDTLAVRCDAIERATTVKPSFWK